MSATGRCTQPGCTGAILDGYCDVCGSPGATSPAQEAEPAAQAGPLAGAQGSSVTSSNRVASAAIGSRRGRARPAALVRARIGCARHASGRA